MKTIAIVFAMEREARATLADPRFAWEAEGDIWLSRRYPMRLALSGVGKVLASWALSRVAGGASLALSLGTSGGLDEGAPGGCRLVSEFVEYDMDVSSLGLERGVTPSAGMSGPVIRTASEGTLVLARRAADAAGVAYREARAASGDRFLSDASAARALRESTGASVVDMECAALAKLCLLRAKDPLGKPLEFLAYRAVSDKADEDAGASFESLVDGQSLVFDAILASFASLYFA